MQARADLSNKSFPTYIRLLAFETDPKSLRNDHRLLHAWFKEVIERKLFSYSGWTARQIKIAHDRLVERLIQLDPDFKHDSPMVIEPIQATEAVQVGEKRAASLIDKFTPIWIEQATGAGLSNSQIQEGIGKLQDEIYRIRDTDAINGEPIPNFTVLDEYLQEFIKAMVEVLSPQAQPEEAPAPVVKPVLPYGEGPPTLTPQEMDTGIRLGLAQYDRETNKLKIELGFQAIRAGKDPVWASDRANELQSMMRPQLQVELEELSLAPFPNFLVWKNEAINVANQWVGKFKEQSQDLLASEALALEIEQTQQQGAGATCYQAKPQDIQQLQQRVQQEKELFESRWRAAIDSSEYTPAGKLVMHFQLSMKLFAFDEIYRDPASKALRMTAGCPADQRAFMAGFYDWFTEWSQTIEQDMASTFTGFQQTDTNIDFTVRYAVTAFIFYLVQRWLWQFVKGLVRMILSVRNVNSVMLTAVGMTVEEIEDEARRRVEVKRKDEIQQALEPLVLDYVDEKRAEAAARGVTLDSVALIEAAKHYAEQQLEAIIKPMVEEEIENILKESTVLAGLSREEDAQRLDLLEAALQEATVDLPTSPQTQPQRERILREATDEYLNCVNKGVNPPFANPQNHQVCAREAAARAAQKLRALGYSQCWRPQEGFIRQAVAQGVMALEEAGERLKVSLREEFKSEGSGAFKSGGEPILSVVLSFADREIQKQRASLQNAFSMTAVYPGMIPYDLMRLNDDELRAGGFCYADQGEFTDALIVVTDRHIEALGTALQNLADNMKFFEFVNWENFRGQYIIGMIFSGIFKIGGLINNAIKLALRGPTSAMVDEMVIRLGSGVGIRAKIIQVLEGLSDDIADEVFQAVKPQIEALEKATAAKVEQLVNNLVKQKVQQQIPLRMSQISDEVVSAIKPEYDKQLYALIYDGVQPVIQNQLMRIERDFREMFPQELPSPTPPEGPTA